MGAGMFGKLPAKRDFVAVKAPRRVLETWEPWLQAGVATAKQALAADWTETYNRAPIWRYWLGADFCGEALLGAFMPSVDGVGRAFPLTVFVSEGEHVLPPPEIDDNDSWCGEAEALLLGALDAGATLEAVVERLEAMPQPTLRPRDEALAGLRDLPDGGTLIDTADREVCEAFRDARRFGCRRAFASQSFWWTIGGEGFAPRALVYVGLPPPVRFPDFLTGAFAEATPAPSRGSP
jgi:type VI secretion system protein ImpM